MRFFAGITCLAAAPWLLAGSPSQATRVEMRNVHFRLDDSLALEIDYLEGKLLPAHDGPVTAIFDDPRSFILEIDAAEVAITTAGLTHLFNTYVFTGKDSPLKNLKVTADGNKIKQKGTLVKGIHVPFEIVGKPEATPEGKIRIHPASIKAAHLPAKGLLDLFGVELAELISSKHARGVIIHEDDIILDPERMLPPPQIKGKVTSVRVQGDRVIQVFGGGRKRGGSELKANYMSYRGGSLRFGKLTMLDADLTLIDKDPADPFDFFLAKYQKQLVAGFSKSTADGGLRTYMPDYNDLVARRASNSSQ